MSPRSKRQFETMRTKSREMIISSATNLFATNGYHTTSIARIAEGAGISKGLIYNYFQSKEELLDTIIQNGFTQIDNMFPAITDHSNAHEMLINEIEIVFEHYKSNFEFWKFYFQIIMQPKINELYSGPTKVFLSEQIAKLTGLFKSAGISHPEYKARTLAALLDGIGVHMIIDEAYPIDDIKNFIINTFIK